MERTEFKTHISAQYNRNLEDLFNHVLAMGGLVEGQLNNAIEAIKGSNSTLASEIKHSDKFVNKHEVEIDSLCARVLARQQPTASDLRLIVSAIRIAVDLERIGDESVNASRLAAKMADVEEIAIETLPGYKALLEMITIDLNILKMVLTCFSQLDLDRLEEVIADDVRITEIKQDSLQEIQDSLNSHHGLAEYTMQMISSIRAAERISAHIVNIAESVVYLINGKDVRSMNSDKLTEFLSRIDK
ncbi:phosphate signaling complex protein PhoU [Thiomicrorhabdus sediminis]|uniref:Phosphate-specific transport system accessory protein PhoU n=1 Tax=Thiomicrorhabdus sediminis TaxID=2580412 RepID=A0A4P9K5V5_9GAMM|nr:phosphate signaling complex protein PhoU [Thiomicrorhabdus sediminis]QCU89656.1 phosphate signaling complex protein PhoU [Thiomicrorhabdus sediminis]